MTNNRSFNYILLQYYTAMKCSCMSIFRAIVLLDSRASIVIYTIQNIKVMFILVAQHKLSHSQKVWLLWYFIKTVQCSRYSGSHHAFWQQPRNEWSMFLKIRTNHKNKIPTYLVYKNEIWHVIFKESRNSPEYLINFWKQLYINI